MEPGESKVAQKPSEPKSPVEQKGSPDFEIAKDSSVDYDERLEAAARLNQEEIKELRKFLLARLPNNGYRQGLDDTTVLGEIGDRKTALEMEQIWDAEHKDGQYPEGQFLVVRKNALMKIRSRVNRD